MPLCVCLSVQRTSSPVRSSLLLEMLLRLSLYYVPMFFVPSILVFIYKGAAV
jgi:hypothetical protein